MADHPDGLNQAMGEIGAVEPPFDIASPRKFAELFEPAGHVYKGCAGSPDDFDAAPVFLVMDMQMAAGDGAHAAGAAGFKKTSARFRHDAGGAGFGFVGRVYEGRHVHHHQHRALFASVQSVAQEDALIGLLRAIGAHQRRIKSNNPPVGDVLQPELRAEVALPGVDASIVQRLIETRVSRRFANIMIARNDQPGTWQFVHLHPGEGEIIFMSGPIEGDIPAMDHQIRWISSENLAKDPPIINEIGVGAR